MCVIRLFPSLFLCLSHTASAEYARSDPASLSFIPCLRPCSTAMYNYIPAPSLFSPPRSGTLPRPPDRDAPISVDDCAWHRCLLKRFKPSCALPFPLPPLGSSAETVAMSKTGAARARQLLHDAGLTRANLRPTSLGLDMVLKGWWLPHSHVEVSRSRHGRIASHCTPSASLLRYNVGNQANPVPIPGKTGILVRKDGSYSKAHIVDALIMP